MRNNGETSSRPGVRAIRGIVSLGVLAIAFACVALFASPASAAYVHSGTFAGPRDEGSPCPEATAAVLCGPGRAAVEQATGNLFVVDSGNDRVQVFAADGHGSAAYLTEFGSGELAAPWGVAIDESGGTTYVYVADAGNHRIVKYVSDGATPPAFAVDPSFTAPGAGEVGDFHAALAVDPGTHDLLVADTANKRIDRFQADGTPAGSFDGSAGAGSPGAFDGPIDLAVNSAGDVYVIDADGPDVGQQEGTSQALRYTASGEYKATLGPVGARERVAAVAVDPQSDEVLISGEQDAVYEEGAYPFLPALQVFNSANQPLSTPGLAETAQYDAVSGLAFAGSDGGFYVVLDHGLYFGTPYGRTQVQAFAKTAPPDVTITPVSPTGVTDSSATVAGTVNPHGKQTSWLFQYRVAGANEWTASPGGDAGTGSSPIGVEETLEGLLGNGTYEVRLTAQNVDGPVFTAPLTFVTSVGPPAVRTGAAPHAAGTALLTGRANPLGLSGNYHFEYGTSTSYGSRVPASDVGIPAGTEFRSLALRVSGLQPGTTYHYRLVAANQYGTHYGEDRTFTTLADEPAPRGFEMVSPVAKNNNDVYPFRGVSSSDGDRLAYSVAGSFPGAPSSTFNNYLAVRGPDGWRSDSIDPPASPSTSAVQVNYYAFTSDLGTGAMTAYTPPRITPEDPPMTLNLYRRDTLSGATKVLSPEPVPGGFALLSFYGASSDLSHMFWDSDIAYLPQATDHQVYEWADGSARIVGVLPDGSVAASADPVGTPRGVSDDGSLAYFNAPATSNFRPIGQLYVRVDGSYTIQVSKPQRPVSGPDPLGTRPAFFRAAADDGRVVLFTSCEKLTEDSTAVASTPECSGSAFSDLYRYDLATETLTDLTTSDPGGGDVLGVAGTSADASTVYFVAAGVLAPGASIGEPNLYVLRDGVTTFIGTLAQADESVWGIPGKEVYDSRVTPDGEHLAFLSRANLNGEAGSGTAQAFLYDAASDSLVCASCDPAGGPESAASFQPPGASAAGRAEVSLPHLLSDNGKRLFFDTAQPLVPQDSNGMGDVYEYTSGGAGLVSTGKSSQASYLLQASPSGDDAFFTTYERLVGTDRDFNADVYDARVGGGFPEPEPGSPPCEGEACQAAAAPYVPRIPVSDRYAGAGNVKERTARRCRTVVKTSRKKHKRAGKHRSRSARKAKRAHGAVKGKKQPRKTKRCGGGHR